MWEEEETEKSDGEDNARIIYRYLINLGDGLQELFRLAWEEFKKAEDYSQTLQTRWLLVPLLFIHICMFV